MQQSQLLSIRLAHSQAEVTREPVQQTAQETITELTAAGNMEAVADIAGAYNEISKVVDITRTTKAGVEDILEIFTSAQLIDMKDLIQAYLGKDIESHLADVIAPKGFPLYVGRLATHFTASDNTVSSAFGAFEARHTNPVDKAIGPREDISRNRAVEANNTILRQFDEYYDIGLNVTLRGPKKHADGGSSVWERGIAESQFLVIDYIRDQLITGKAAREPVCLPGAMTIEDIETNIYTILNNKRVLLHDVTEISPMLAEQLEQAIGSVTSFSVESYHRGRMSETRFRHSPDAARRAIVKVEDLLIRAAKLSELQPDQEEIPILDL